MDVLLGRVYPLKLGFIGVVNRSQQDINKNKDIKSAQAMEAQFFSSHPLYRSISNRLGTPFLSKQLNKVLVHHIRDAIPELKMKGYVKRPPPFFLFLIFTFCLFLSS